VAMSSWTPTTIPITLTLARCTREFIPVDKSACLAKFRQRAGSYIFRALFFTCLIAKRGALSYFARRYTIGVPLRLVPCSRRQLTSL